MAADFVPRELGMDRRYDVTNLPIELIRVLDVVAEAGSYARAAEQVHVAQDALRAQITHLQELLGFDLFISSEEALHLTKRGATVLSYAQRILFVNGELMSLSAEDSFSGQLRVGMPSWVPHRRLIEVVERCSAAHGPDQVTFHCDSLESLMRDLNLGHLDMTFLCNVVTTIGVPFAEWTEPLYWIKSPRLKLRPGEPVRLVSWSGGISDRLATRLFQDAGIHYTITFSGPDSATRIAAVAAGLGVMLSNERAMTADVVPATECFLPAPPQIKTGIYIRENLDVASIAPLARAFEAVMAPRRFAQEVVALKVR
jgi:DNA-binding transcriptional LysR family regulator